MDYTAIGQTVHLASRMEQMATPGSILMTPDALRLAEGYVQVKPLGPVSVKGLTSRWKFMKLPELAPHALGCKPQPRADSLALSDAMLKPSSFAKRLNKHAQTMVRWSVS